MKTGITKITLKGYKSINKEQSIEIKPLTILAGANSSGKSSFLQPLLLMKQTLEASFDPGPLLINGPIINFTSTEQFLSKTKSKQAKEFSISIKDEQIEIGLVFRRNNGSIIIEDMSYENSSSENSITSKFNLNCKLTHEKLTKIVNLQNFNGTTFFNEFGKPKFKLVVIRNRCFLAVAFSIGENKGNLRPNIDFSETHQRYITELIHLPGIRGNPERTYQVTSLGYSPPGKFEYYIASIINYWQMKKNFKKLNSLNEDLKTLGITKNVTAYPIGETRIELKVPRTKTSEKDDLVSLSDVGLGVSQSLPILVALNVAKPNQLVYIEQPELHLHPRAQVSMAKVLAKAAKRGVKVVVETHSSLLLLAIQTLIAENELSPDLVKLHWFSQDESGSTKVTSAELDENGAFGDWPEDFGDVELEAQNEYLTATENKFFGKE